MSKLSNILFIDIETVPNQASYDLLSEQMKRLWNHKASFLAKNGEDAETLYARAGIYAEFGKIVCISVAFITEQNERQSLRVKSFFSEDEKTLLQDFFNMFSQSPRLLAYRLCAHNGKEFDFPYISRRALVNRLPLPSIFDFAGKKPWEVKHIDTLELWKFGDYKHYTSLELLGALFGIPSPKEDMDGSQVAQVFWQENNLSRIASYCEKDVVTLARIYQIMNGLDPIDDDAVFSLTDS